MEFNGALRLFMACLGWLNTRLHNLYQRGSYQNHQWANLFHFLETNIRTTGCCTAAWKNQNKCSCRQGVVWICHARQSHKAVTRSLPHQKLLTLKPHFLACMKMRCVRRTNNDCKGDLSSIATNSSFDIKGPKFQGKKLSDLIRDRKLVIIYSRVR